MPKKEKKDEKSGISNSIYNLFEYVKNRADALNQSKIFAGIMIVILNIASKFVTIKVSKTMESYLKFTFSRDILVFAITWMGTRDIFSALIMTGCFILIVDYLMNEESQLCMLPESFTDYHISKLENTCPTPEEVAKAKAVIETAEKCNKERENMKDESKNNVDSTYSGISSW